MKLPDANMLRLFHEAQSQEFGGSAKVRPDVSLEEFLARVSARIASQGLGVADAAALLSHEILHSRPFVQGNRRTAYGALVMVLSGNNTPFLADDISIMTAIVAARQSDTPQELAAWIKSHLTVPMPSDEGE